MYLSKEIIFELVFPMGMSRDKGTTGQAQILAKGRDGPGQLKSGTGRAGTAKIRDGTGRDTQNPGRDARQNRTEQKITF
mgnify:CR=1 FL=1